MTVRRWSRLRGRRAPVALAALFLALPALLAPAAAAMPAPEPGTAAGRVVVARPAAAVVIYPRLVPVAPPPCYAGSTRATSTPCWFGPDAARRTVAVVVDSHGWAWWPAIRAAAVRAGVRVAVFGKTACGAVETPRAYPFPTGLRGYDECPSWQADTARAVAALAPDAVILSSASTAWLPVSPADPANERDQAVRDARWRAGIVAAVTRYRRLADRVLWLADSPVTTPAALDCAIRVDATPQRCGLPLGAARAPGHGAEVAATAALRVPLLDVVPRLCSPAWCPSFQAGRPTHRNSGHLAYDWTLVSPVARAFWRDALRRALA